MHTQGSHPTTDWRLDKTPSASQQAKAPFLRQEQENLLELRAALARSMHGIAHETRFEKSDSFALANHGDDAASDACDRDFALSLLAEGTNALLEIDEALTRIEAGTYGTCQMSGRPIPVPCLRAIPFARFTVECQAEIEARRKLFRRPRDLVPLHSSEEQARNQARNGSGSLT